MDERAMADSSVSRRFSGTENSSKETKDRAATLAEELGSNHMSIVIDMAIAAILTIFATCTGQTPNFRSKGGEIRENLALQNVQASVL